MPNKSFTAMAVQARGQNDSQLRNWQCGQGSKVSTAGDKRCRKKDVRPAHTTWRARN